MDAILTDSHLNTRIKRCILMNLVVPKLEHAGEPTEGNGKFVKQLETLQRTAAAKKDEGVQGLRVIQHNWERTHMRQRKVEMTNCCTRYKIRNMAEEVTPHYMVDSYM